MILTVSIPDELASDLGAGFEDLSRAALEALASEAYGRDVLSLEQVRQMLNLETRWQTQEILSRHAVWPGQSADEILRDAESSRTVRKES